MMAQRFLPIVVSAAIGFFISTILQLSSTPSPSAQPYYYTVTSKGTTCRSNQSQAVDAAMKGLTGPTISSNDERLLAVLKNHIIDFPTSRIPKMSMPLFQTPQAKRVDALLKHKKHGFFVECGGLDGERSSNTIFFEQKRDWTGLLVEMDPSWYMQLRGKNRKCFSINACISPNNYPMKMFYKEHKMGEGKLVTSTDNSAPDVNTHPVYCFPLYSMLLALNNTHVDYFSLDVEGFELTVLRSIPWKDLDISVISVEYIHGKEGEAAHIDFMKEQGYYLHSRVSEYKPEIYFGCNDFIFVKNGL